MNKEQRRYCGWKGFISPPFWMMHEASCKIHDENYKIGGDWIDRMKADQGFLRYMLRDSNQYKGIVKCIAILSSYVYYWSVRLLGRFSFNYH